MSLKQAPVSELFTPPTLSPAPPPPHVGGTVTGNPGSDVETLDPAKPYGIGIDCHSKFIVVCVLLRSTEHFTRHSRHFNTGWDDLLEAAAWIRELAQPHLATPDAPLDYTLESTGCYHLPVIRALQGTAHIVNPTLAGGSRRKTDKLDAALLAWQDMCALWRTSYVPNDHTQAVRVHLLLRRKSASNARAAINRLNNFLLRFGITLGRHGSLAASNLRPVVEDLIELGVVSPDHELDIPGGTVPESLRPEISRLYADYDGGKKLAAQHLKDAIAQVKSMEFEFGDTVIPGKEALARLQTVPGVGEILAVTWLSEIYTYKRFPNAKALSAYCGCDPSLKVSAGKVTAQVRRKGNSVLHALLLQCAQQLLNRRTDPFGKWGYALASRRAKGGWLKAVGALSRRIACGLYHVQRSNEDFKYTGYGIVEESGVIPNVPVQEMGLSPRLATKLQSLGLTTSHEVQVSFYSGLKKVPGVGDVSLAEISEWLSANTQIKRQRNSASTPEPTECQP